MSAAEQLQRIAAVVNDSIISTRELRERTELALISSGLDANPVNRRRIAPQVLERFIDEQLQMQEARRLGVTVSEAEIAQAVERLARSNNMSPNQLYRGLLERGITPTTLNRQIEAEIAWVKLVRAELGSRVVVTDEQVDLALDAISAPGEVEVLLSELLLPVYSPDQEREVLNDARELLTSLREGADFERLATQVSIAASRERGGDLGWVPLAGIARGLRPTIAALEPGEVSDPVRSPAGVHLFHVRDRREVAGGEGDPEDLRLAQLFYPLDQRASEAEADDLIARAGTIRGRLEDCEDMVRMAEQTAAPSSGDLGWMQLRDLPSELAEIIAALPVERVSEPVRSLSGVHLLMVCERGSDVQDGGERERQSVRRRLEQEQIQRLANRYLRDLRGDAFIDVRIGDI